MLIVRFRTRKLEKCFSQSEYAIKTFGDQVGREYIQRINIIKSTRSLEDLKGLPSLRCHSLKGKRSEQYAINLTGLYRLIFTVEGETLNVVRIDEVSKHYDD